jgi:CheY-like chemotaxis protein
MIEKKMLVLGSRETFLIRSLVKKTNDMGIAAKFISWEENAINAINASWEGVSLVTFYLDIDERIPGDVLRFLADKMLDDGGQMILVGDSADTVPVCDRIPGELIYKMFTRPLNNEEYFKTIKGVFDKIGSGEFYKSILIVDDDPNYLALVREWLKGPYKVSMANSGLQAIKWLGKNKADLILLDHEMPITSGPQVLEMLRNDVDTASIPVMFLTGKSDKESVMAVLSLRPEGYFLKTIEKDELLQQLKAFFIRHK